MATVKIDPDQLKILGYLGRGTYVIFELTPEKSYAKVVGRNIAAVVPLTAKVESPHTLGVRLGDLSNFVRATGVYEFDIGPQTLKIESQGMSARFPTIPAPEGTIGWQEGTFEKLPQPFVTAVERFGSVADAAGTLAAAFFVKDKNLVVTDKVRYIRASAGDVGDMVLSTFDPRVLQGMTEYHEKEGSVVFRGGSAQVIAARVAQGYPPDLQPPEEGIPLNISREQLNATPSDYVVIYQDGKGGLVLKTAAPADYEVVVQAGEWASPIYVQFSRKGMMEGMIDGGSCDIVTLGSTRAFRVRADGYLYLLAEYVV